jgi:small subunit ribosomal protein S6
VQVPKIFVADFSRLQYKYIATPCSSPREKGYRTQKEVSPLRRYETIFIANPDLPEEDQSALQEKVRSLLASFKGELVKMEDWGLKKLSYTIRKSTRGRYFLVDYLTESPALVRELERTLRINDGVLKFLTVKTSNLVTNDQVQALKAASQAEKSSREEARPAPPEPAPVPPEAEKTEAGGEEK